MAKIPKKTIERLQKTVGKFQRILEDGKSRDVNEADTVKIVADILAEVFGYDKYTEITSGIAIRNTFCDLAIKTNEKIQFLIEVKAIGLDLKENHLRQAIGYGAREGVKWVVLTNGIIWQIYRIRSKIPINYDCLNS